MAKPLHAQIKKAFAIGQDKWARVTKYQHACANVFQLVPMPHKTHILPEPPKVATN